MVWANRPAVGGAAMTHGHEPETLLQAWRNLRQAIDAAIGAPLLPLLTRICDTLTRWVEMVQP